MIENRTVLVVGAGASKPYGFPLGRELRDAVIRAAHDTGMASRIGPIGGYDDELQEFATDLAESGYSSVDAFLENRSEWTKIGKAAMALCLLSSEMQSSQRLFPPGQPPDHWYETLWSRWGGGSWHSFKSTPLTIVTFNYDRSLEHYLIRVAANNYGLRPETVARQLPIIHVHGSLGDYCEYPYGAEATDDVHHAARSAIRIVHEAQKDDPNVLRAQGAILESERVLFVGFGYHPQNMARLGFADKRRKISNPDRMVLGTHKGFTHRAWARVCETYRFPRDARSQGTGSISDLISDWLE